MISGITTITSKETSHTYGWARTWSENLGGIPINHTCEPSDVVFFDHGVNFGGSLNLFGGFTEKHEQCMVNLSKAKQVWSLDLEMPAYLEMYLCRKDVEISPGLARDFAAFCCRARGKTLRSTDLGLPWLAVGDSHTAAWAPWNSMVVKTNGKTLNGQIRSNFQYVRDHIEMCPQIKGVTLSFGNIDVRHHICRLDADWREMWRNYKKFGDSLPIEVEYALPWPAEFEGRKLPKTGWYKDQPFWGSQLERSRLVEDIASFCDEIGMNVIHYPAEWRTMDPEVYAKERMEKPQSVHLSPKHYRRHNWGNENSD